MQISQIGSLYHFYFKGLILLELKLQEGTKLIENQVNESKFIHSWCGTVKQLEISFFLLLIFMKQND